MRRLLPMHARQFLCLLVAILAASAATSLALQRASDAPPVELRVGFAKPGGGYAVQTIPLEIYVSRVLAGEAARDSAPAALEALAVTIRTFALANRDRHRADGFDLCDETHCQVLRAATAGTTRAATATAGQVLTRNGLIASVFYSASCGGRTEIPSDVWPGADDPPYLPVVDDDACNGGPQWTTDISEVELLRALRAAGFRGARLKGFRIASRNESGRVARLAVEGLVPSQISGQDLRVAVGRSLGWQRIKSTAFELERVSGGYRLTGHGSGHGVGLCVIGSANLGARGVSAADILGRYFPGTVIASAGPRMAPAPPAVIEPAPVPVVVPRRPAPAPLPVADVRVVLADDDEGARVSLARVTQGARDDIAKALGVMPPSPVTVRFHPTTDAFERATGRAWFTSGAILDGEMHFVPISGLRERGVLERTLRQALVHVMIDRELTGRPAWVREGAAIYFGGPRQAGGDANDQPRIQAAPRTPCPTDAELEQPRSMGELATAYARARACFARQMTSGRSWRDVK